MPEEQSEYPVSAALAEELQDFMHDPRVKLIVEAVGEYEHGSVDLQDVGPDFVSLVHHGHEAQALRMYAAVALDLALVLVNADLEASR